MDGSSPNSIETPVGRQGRRDEVASLDALLDLKAQGKVRFIGMSGTLPNLEEQIEMGVFDVFQIPYSALERKHEELITRASQAGAGIVIRGGAARGAPTKEGGDSWELWQEAHLDDLLDGMTRMEFILRFTCSHPDLDTTIVGTLNMDHLRENMRALERGPLDPGTYEEAKHRLAAAGSRPA